MENEKGIKSFLKVVTGALGAEYDEKKVDDLITSSDYNYDSIIDDANKRLGIPDEELPQYREKAITKYKIQPLPPEVKEAFQYAKTDVAQEEYTPQVPLAATGLRGITPTQIQPEPIKRDVFTYPKAKEGGGFTRYEDLHTELDKADQVLDALEGKGEDIEDYNMDVSGLPGIETFGRTYKSTRKYPEGVEEAIKRVKKKRDLIVSEIDNQVKQNIEATGYASLMDMKLNEKITEIDPQIVQAIKDREENATELDIPRQNAPVKIHRPEDIKRLKDLKDTREIYMKMSKALRAPQGSDLRNQLDGFYYGLFKSNTAKDFFSMGFNEMSRNLNVMDAFDTYTAELDKLREANPEAAQLPRLEQQARKALSPEQLGLLDAYEAMQQLQQVTPENMGAKVGRGLQDMVPFILEFAATGGSAAVAEKAAAKLIGRFTQQALLKKAGGKAVKILAQGAMMPTFEKSIVDRIKPTIDAEGNLAPGEELASAVIKSWLSTSAEVLGEEIAPLIAGKAYSAAARRLAQGDASVAEDLFLRLSMAFTRETGVPTVQGIPFEMLSEEVTGVAQAIIDQDGSFFTADSQKQLLWLTTIAGASAMAGHAPMRFMARQSLARKDEALSKVMDADYESFVRNLVETTPNPDNLLDALDEGSKVFKGRISQEDYLAARDFIMTSAKVNMMDSSRAIQLEMNLRDKSDSQGNITTVELDGETYYIGNVEDIGVEGAVIFVKDKDNQVKAISQEKLINRDVNTYTPDEVRSTVSQEDQMLENLEAEKKAQEEALAKEEAEASPQVQDEVESELPDGTKVKVSTMTNGKAVVDLDGTQQEFNSDQEATEYINEVIQQKNQEMLDNMDPVDAYNKTKEEDPELAREILQAEIQTLKDEAETLRTQKGGKRSEVVERVTRAKKAEAEVARLEEVLAAEDEAELQTREAAGQVDETKMSQPDQVYMPEEAKRELTIDENGNAVFIHYGTAQYETLDPAEAGKNTTDFTPAAEVGALGRAGGAVSLYTHPNQKEPGVKGSTPHTLSVPLHKVYHLQTDPLGFFEEAKRRFEEKNPGMPFSANDQALWVSKVANDHGFDVLVTDWSKGPIAKLTKPMKPTGARFTERPSRMPKVGDELEVGGGEYTVTSIDDKYINMERETGKRSIPIEHHEQLINRFIKMAPTEKVGVIPEGQSGVTFDMDGNEWQGQGNVVAFHSKNVEGNPSKEEVMAFAEEVKEELPEGAEVVVGAFKSEKGDFTSIDVSFVFPLGMEEEAVAFGKQAGQESVYNTKGEGSLLDTGETGQNPLPASESLRIFDNNKYYDKENRQWVPGVKREGAAPQQAGAQQGKSRKEIETDRILQESEGKVTASDKSKEDLGNKRNALKALVKKAKEVGVPVNVIHSSEAPAEVLEAWKDLKNRKMEVVRKMTQGHPQQDAMLALFEEEFDKAGYPGVFHNGQAYIFSDRITSVSEIVKTYLHESGAHKGLRDLFAGGDQTLLGKQYESVNEVFRDVWKSMNLKQRKKIADVYMAGKYTEEQLKEGVSREDQELMGDEFLADLSEEDKVPSKFKNFFERLAQIFRKAFGLTGTQYTTQDLRALLIESRIKLREAEGVMTPEDFDIRMREADRTGVAGPIGMPTTISRFRAGEVEAKPVKINEEGHELSFVTKERLFDIKAFLNEVSDKKQKIWFWGADFLGRGMYFDKVLNEEHYLDAGPSYALDPENAKEGKIWASSMPRNKMVNNLNNSDYIAIVGLSPTKAKLFNRRVFDLFKKRVESSGGFDKFREEALSNKPTNGIVLALGEADSWEWVDNTNVITGYKKDGTPNYVPARKVLLDEMLVAQGRKTMRGPRKVFTEFNALLDIPGMMDGFYRDNGFQQNDILVVLKPSGFAKGSKHSTYLTDVLGEVIGVPDHVIDAHDILPKSIQKRPELQRSQKSQVVAPFGSGIRQVDVRFKVDNDASKTQEFFSDVVTGKSDRYKPIHPWKPILPFTAKEKAFQENFSKFKGAFDEHIATSIPAFREVQIKVGATLADMYQSGGLMYDLGGSEGGFAKAVTMGTGGKMKSINLDPNPDMQAVHEASAVAGSIFVAEAFEEGFDEFKKHEPTELADVVHESMMFQFVRASRKEHLREVARYLKPDGVFITEEKFKLTDTAQQKANEAKKNEDFKTRYYSQDQINEKAEAVLVGMHKDQANYTSYIKELERHFRYVREYWDGGNFKGVIATNNKAKFEEFLSKIGDTDTEFSEKNINKDGYTKDEWRVRAGVKREGSITPVTLTESEKAKISGRNTAIYARAREINIELTDEEVAAVAAFAEVAGLSDDQALRVLDKGKTSGRIPTRPETNKEATGSKVTPVASSYVEAADEAPAGRNLWVRNSESVSNQDRVLAIQFAPETAQRRTPFDKYFDLLYRYVPGYDRTSDFWEVPPWIARISSMEPNTDVYVVRSMEEADKFLKDSGYGKVLFSAMDVTKSRIKQLVSANPEVSFQVGTYAAFDEINEFPNAQTFKSVEEYARANGLPLKYSYDYSHFAGTSAIPRLRTSEGCHFACAFCSNTLKVKELPYDEIMQQVEDIRNLDAALVYIGDKAFGQAKNAEVLAEMYTKIKEYNPGFEGFIVQTSALDFANTRVFSKEYLERAHIKYVELGIETGNDDILLKLNKPHSRRIYVDRAMKNARDNNVKIIPNIIVGLAGTNRDGSHWEESKNTYQNTLDLLESNKDVISHINVYSLAIYNNTEIADNVEAISEGDADENVVEKSFHKNPEAHQWAMNQFLRFGSEQILNAYAPETRFRLDGGFYSPTERALDKITQKKGTPEQFKAMLLKNGAKQAELDWMDFDGAFADKKSITKQEIQDWIDGNRVEVEEVTKGEGQTTTDDAIIIAIESINGNMGLSLNKSNVVNVINRTDSYSIEFDQQVTEFEGDNIFTVPKETVASNTKYSQYQEPGGENYTELLLTMPSKRKVYAKEDYMAELIEKYGLENEPYQSLKWKKEVFTEEENAKLKALPSRGEGERIGKPIDGTFKSSHFDEPNILTHIRFNERDIREPNPDYLDPKTHTPNFDTDYELVDYGDSYKIKNKKTGVEYFNSYAKSVLAENNMDEQGMKEYMMKNSKLGKIHSDFKDNPKSILKRVLFLEEIQSDWAQKGREEGFKDTKAEQRIAELKKQVVDKYPSEYFSDILLKEGDPLVDELKQIYDEKSYKRVPNMPFKQTTQWVNLALRRMIRYAAENGFDRIAWTTGEMQAERYKEALTKEIKSITPTTKNLEKDNSVKGLSLFVRSSDGDIYFEVDSDAKITYQDNVPDGMGNFVGKDLSEVIGKDAAEQAMASDYAFETKDIVVRSEGMKTFYDKIVPNLANKLGKKFGAKVEPVSVDKNIEVSSLPITDKMKESALTEGMPLFRIAPPVNSDAFKKWFGDSKVVDAQGRPLVVYHGTASDFNIFDKSKGKQNFESSELGFYFTNAPKPEPAKGFFYGSTASEYAQNAQEKGYSEPDGANVMPVYLVMRNPLTINAEGWYSPNTAIDKQRGDIKRELERGNYDGIIAEDPTGENGGNERIYVVFSPTQIKSATANVGTYDPNNPDIRFKIKEEASKVDTNPSKAQVEAGNYKKGHVQLDGLNITIENPEGSIRWFTDDTGAGKGYELPAHYGYIKGTVGNDGDAVDLFLGPNPKADKVYVIDQVNPETGKFDEHKVMYGFDSISQARNTYRGAYDKDWKGFGSITRASKEELQDWLKQGDKSKPYAETRFKVDLTNPETQKLVEQMKMLRKVSESVERREEMKDELADAPVESKQAIRDRIKAYKQGVRLGKRDMRDEIEQLQKAIISYATKNMPKEPASAGEVRKLLMAVKNAKTPKTIDNAFNKIDELTAERVKAKARRKIDRIVGWMTGYRKQGNKKYGKFPIAYVRRADELKAIVDVAQEQARIKFSRSKTVTEEMKDAADVLLEEAWNKIESKENKDLMDEVTQKLIEMHRLGKEASEVLLNSIAEDLGYIYDKYRAAGENMREEERFQRTEDKEKVLGYLRTAPDYRNMAGFRKVSTQIGNLVANLIGNWETLMTVLGGEKLRDEYSLLLNEVDMEMGTQESFNNVLDEAMEIYGFKSRKQMLQHLQDLKKPIASLPQPLENFKDRVEGSDLRLSKLQLIDLWLATRQEDIAEDAYKTYGDAVYNEKGERDMDAQAAIGKQRIEQVLDNLSEEDKAFAASMQRTVSEYHAKMNDVFVKIFKRDLPKSANYWMSTAEFRNDVDVFNNFMNSSKHPSATQARTAHRTVKIGDAFDKFSKHVKQAEWYANMALPLDKINRVFGDLSVKNLIRQSRSDVDKDSETTGIYGAIKSMTEILGLSRKTGEMTDAERIGGGYLGNWVAAKIGGSLSVPFKQLTSVINYTEDMPAEKWALGFAKALADPAGTWKYMMETAPYLQDRLQQGYSEAMQYAMNANRDLPKATNFQQAMKNYATMGTRYGDITAIIFGGRPYIEHLISQGMTKEEAVNKFLLSTLRSQQAPFSSSLSVFQNAKHPFMKALFTFANTPSQYMRKMYEANFMLKHGDINVKQWAKVQLLYGVANQIFYVAMGAWVSALLRGDDWTEDLAEQCLVQIVTSFVGGVPVFKDLAGSIAKDIMGLPQFDSEYPMIESIYGVYENTRKATHAEEPEDRQKYLKRASYSLFELFGAPAYNISKLWNATVNREETVNERQIEKVSSKLTEMAAEKKKIDKSIKGTSKVFIKARQARPDYQTAETAQNLKNAVSTARSKARALEAERDLFHADMLRYSADQALQNLASGDLSLFEMQRELDKLNESIRKNK